MSYANQKTAKIGDVQEASGAYTNSSSLKNHLFADDYSLVKKAKEGVKTEIFYSLAERINMPEKLLASFLNLSPRTISNYRDQKKELDPNYSEHLLKLINLYELGTEVFGNIEEFNVWLSRPFWNSEEIPVSFLNTPGGVDLISVEIEKLAQGYPL